MIKIDFIRRNFEERFKFNSENNVHFISKKNAKSFKNKLKETK